MGIVANEPDNHRARLRPNKQRVNDNGELLTSPCDEYIKL